MNPELDFTQSDAFLPQCGPQRASGSRDGVEAGQRPALPSPVIEWQDEYSVGIGVLDEDHRHIFHLLNRLHEALLLEEGRAALGFLLDELILYIRRHFAGEELLMQAFAYPEELTHELEHERLVRVLLEFREQFADGREQLLTPLLDFMEGWLIRHILASDRRYSGFFAERGARR